MFREIFEHCGVFAWPQLVVWGVTVSILAGYVLGRLRGEAAPGRTPWTRTLEPLAGIATTLGLLGSVAGFLVAFQGFGGRLDVEKLMAGLAKAYWTTGVGIATALVASVGSWMLTAVGREGAHDGR
jgi:hypothetical protein